jgi:signal transduction histidine kinase
MRLAIKGSLAFLILYVVILGAVTLWIELYLRSVADDMMDKTAWLIGSEIARAVSESATEQLLKEDAHTRQKLVDIVDDVTEHSQVVASLAVVDEKGKVVAGDGIEVGRQLAIPTAIFHQNTPNPRGFKVHLAGGDYHLFVPLFDPSSQVMGYVRLGLRSRRISRLYYRARRQLLVAASTGFLAVILIGWILHVQLSRRSDALIQALSGSARGEDIRFSSRDEFASALETARRVGEELTAAREERSHAHRRLGALVKAMNIGVLLLGKGKSLDFANPPARELFGCPEPHELERRWPEIGAMFDGMQKQQASRQVDLDVPVNGETSRLRLELYRLDEPDGEGHLVLVKSRDSLSALENELGLAIQMRGLARFYKAFAHDLKAPLNAMVMNLELLKETLRERDGGEPRRERQLKYAEVIRQELWRLDRQLRTLLSHVVPADDTAEQIDLCELIRNLGDLLAPQAKQQRVSLTTDVPEHEILFTGHRDRLKQAMLNIAINALEAMPNGGNLSIGLARQDERAEIQVRDDGPGIAPELLAKVYEMHFTTKSGGTGVGLFVARSVVESQGGKIQVDSQPGSGTCFRVELPLVSAET